MHFKWKYTTPTSEQDEAAKALGEKLNMSTILAQLLIRRGISTESAAKRFFRPQLGDLINPFLMKDMDVAVDRLNDAMGRKEKNLGIWRLRCGRMHSSSTGVQISTAILFQYRILYTRPL